MIQPQEFRIGNAVYCKYRHGHYLVTEINETDIRIKEPERGHKFWESYETIIPIPLSPEILLACGFTPLSDPEFTHHHPELNILFDGESFWLKEGSVTHYLSKCEYLHKLQNGVFWVTGKELIVNIEKVKV